MSVPHRQWAHKSIFSSSKNRKKTFNLNTMFHSQVEKQEKKVYVFFVRRVYFRVNIEFSN